MTDDDSGRPLRLPPERDVSPELRARVLARATDGAPLVRRDRRRFVAPVLAGLAAAAVVVAVAVSIDRDSGSKPVPPTGRDPADVPMAEDHRARQIDRGSLGDDTVRASRATCSGVDPVEQAGHVLSARRLLSPSGLTYALVRSNTASGNQYFCTPFGIVTSNLADTQVSASEPVLPIAGARAQGRLVSPDGGATTTYVDGAWFAVHNSVTTLEVRMVVGGVPRGWQSTERNSGYVFAYAWEDLTSAELAGPLIVEYRAISVDGQVFTVPGFSSLPTDASVAPAVRAGRLD